MKLHPPYKLFSTATGMEMTAYKLRKPYMAKMPPKIEEITGGKCCFGADQYNEALDEWQASKVTVKVQEESVKPLKMTTRDLLLKTTDAANVRLHARLLDGIDVTSLAERLEFYQVAVLPNEEIWFVRLLPEKVKEEEFAKPDNETGDTHHTLDRYFYSFNAYLWNKGYVKRGKVDYSEMLKHIDEFLRYIKADDKTIVMQRK